jgi:sensor histidine kinase YesM
MHESLEPDSNVTFESEEQPAKHIVQIRSTDDGMKIDESAEQSRKTPGPIHESSEPDSNVTSKREEHRQKQISESS